MLRLFPREALQSKARKIAIYLQAAVLVGAGLTPLVLTETASAAQLTTRSVTISTSQAEATGVEYEFGFTLPSTTAVQGIVFEFCTTPLSTCTLPTDMNVDHAGAAGVSVTQTFSQATAFTEYDADGSGDLGDCDNADAGAASTQYCVTRTQGGLETADSKEITLTGIVNPSMSVNYQTVYVRVALYSDTAFATQVHEGTVAAAIARQLTINGRVQERLLFCVAAIDDGGALDGDLPADMTECGAITDPTVVDLGVIDNSTIARSPVPNTPPTSQGNNKYGIAMVNTNASGGVSVTYFAEPDSTGTEQLRNFRVPGATCDASDTDVFDQCFKAASVATEMAVGNEDFGLNIPCIVSDGSTQNLAADVDYDNEGTTTQSADCENTDTDYYYHWNGTTSTDGIASSNTVVDNEILKLSFAATASATTPTGSYTVTSTYIATPQF